MMKPFRLTRPVVPESAVLEAVLQCLAWHPRVAFAYRMNTGAGYLGHKDKQTGEMRWSKQFITFGFPGCPDVLGALKDGRLLCVETKSSRGPASEDQKAFLAKVREAGGVAILARSVDDVMEGLRLPAATPAPRTGFDHCPGCEGLGFVRNA